MRQLPSGRVILIDVMPMVFLLQKANHVLDPSILDFVDDVDHHHDLFRVSDLGRGLESPDNVNPLMKLPNPQKEAKHDVWRLSEILNGESDWPADDVNALRSSLNWSPMKGWMRIMLNAVEELRDSLRDKVAQQATAKPNHKRMTLRLGRRTPPLSE